jgi:DNA mismatch repair protein MutS
VDPSLISARYDAVEELGSNPEALSAIRDSLRGCDDLQRHAGKLGTLRSGPRDLAGIALTATRLPGLMSVLGELDATLLSESAEMDLLADVAEWITGTLSDDPPLRPGDHGTVRDGFSPELDGLREIRRGGRSWIDSLVEREREATGIPKLSVGFNKVFGYYIEISKNYMDSVPEHYTRKQTLTGSERFVTPELKEMEARILRAEEQMTVLEREIFEELRSRVAGEVDRIRRTGEMLADLDVLASLALMSAERGYVRPSLVPGPALDIVNGRHPVLDRVLPAGECVPNHVSLHQARRILLVTGPNMAGKSTYLREAALLTVMAQAGSFVPAESMSFSPVDRIFTRIGSSDHLMRGQSTFLVEMSEVALMLNACTRHSLAILDEVGRGTSTFDGLSIAWAMVEYLHENPEHRPLVLFATHYHELSALVSRLPAAAGVCTQVRETGKKVVFLYRVEDGSADRSYGIHVASMAGVPGQVLKRARQVMEDLEKGRHLMPGSGMSDQLELPLNSPEHPLLEEIRTLQPDTLTPRRALEILYELMDRLD